MNLILLEMIQYNQNLVDKKNMKKKLKKNILKNIELVYINVIFICLILKLLLKSMVIHITFILKKEEVAFINKNIIIY